MGVYPLLPKGGHTAPYRREQSRGFLLWPTRFPGLAVSHSSLSTAYHFKRLFSLPPGPSATESGCGLLPAKCVWLPLAASPGRMVTDKTMSTAPNRLNALFPRLSVIGLASIVWKAATNPEGTAKTQLFKKSPSRYPWSKMQNGQQNAGRSATLEIYALLLGMGKWRGTSAKAIQGVPKGIKRTDTKKSAEKSRESGS